MGRIRYLGVILYDADHIEEAGSAPDEGDLYAAQLKVFLNPHDPAVQAQPRLDGIPDAWLEAARQSPIWKMAMERKIAFPLHPEYRTLPLVWYVPPLSPIAGCGPGGGSGDEAIHADLSAMLASHEHNKDLVAAEPENHWPFLSRLLECRASKSI